MSWKLPRGAGAATYPILRIVVCAPAAVLVDVVLNIQNVRPIRLADAAGCS